MADKRIYFLNTASFEKKFNSILRGLLSEHGTGVNERNTPPHLYLYECCTSTVGVRSPRKNSQEIIVYIVNLNR